MRYRAEAWIERGRGSKYWSICLDEPCYAKALARVRKALAGAITVLHDAGFVLYWVFEGKELEVARESGFQLHIGSPERP